MLINAAIVASFESDLFNCFTKKCGDMDATPQSLPLNPCFLPRDFNTRLQLRGIVRQDFSADAILKRRNDLSASGIVFRVC